MAKGSQKIKGLGDKKQISVYFDTETFEEINNLATQKKTSFANVVRELVEWGLMDAQERNN